MSQGGRPDERPERRIAMRRSVFALAALVVSLGVAAPAAAATSTVAVQMTFTEPLKAGFPGSGPCPDIAIDFNCGSGQVIPFGHATEEVAIGVCGETCNIREIVLPQGTIILREIITSFSCPGVCGSQGPLGTPFELTSTAIVIDGDGIFSGATGSLTGTVVAAGWHGQVKLAGTITLVS